ncbi:uncharacterized protein [Physcomitrium patens]|uniref:CRAL-TRIO domain-containing protein n=1 Tax=Physcomitrium patens TaxID=3218 RepID=A0A2K1KFV1_PHYPA|nr:uncharacterized protein LOC112284059 [Physcomitrium patens]PNR52645.1 hypothetical protein PHYPA_009019 [Physcomitrium patens]|eukprot:XP_024379333.1 uncharacterized protein LOC112284059 [Physcomitrella patens]
MERNPILVHPAKVEPEASLSDMIKQVLRLVQKDGPLDKKQAEFCDDACVTRYLKARGNNVRRAARMLRATLNWREKINIGYLIADEFPAEIAAGAAYVAGHDEEGRPILVVKKKPEYIVNGSHKQHLRYIIFTMEVAIASMPPGVDQWVLILDAGGYSRMSAPSTSGILTTLKMLADHYPERLAKAFIVDASSMFYYVWKGICTFVDHSTRGKLGFAYTRDYRVVPKPQPTKFTPSMSPLTKPPRRRSISYCAEDFKSPKDFRQKAVSTDYSQLEPIFDVSPKREDSKTSSGKLSEGPELAGSTRTRSFSFSSITGTTTCTSPDATEDVFSSFRKDDEDLVAQLEIPGPASTRARRPSWDGFVSIFYPMKKEEPLVIEEAKNRNVGSFRPYLSSLQAPYDEAAYRALMKPPLGGLVTIISKDLKHVNSM